MESPISLEVFPSGCNLSYVTLSILKLGNRE